MPLALIVVLLVIGATLVLALAGYLIDRTAARHEREHEER
jgi:type II secretory pathway pseudopilin PulG